jgi:hypothetical protein
MYKWTRRKVRDNKSLIEVPFNISYAFTRFYVSPLVKWFVSLNHGALIVNVDRVLNGIRVNFII